MAKRLQVYETAEIKVTFDPEICICFLARRYRSEYVLIGIPAPVQRIAFPLLVAIGGLLGRYRQYADAPKPLPSRIGRD